MVLVDKQEVLRIIDAYVLRCTENTKVHERIEELKAVEIEEPDLYICTSDKLDVKNAPVTEDDIYEDKESIV